MSINGKAPWPLILVILVVCVCFLYLLYLPQSKGADTDVGNVAVIEADTTILQPGEDFDLNNQTLTFTPKSGGGYTVDVGALEFDSNLGTNLGLGNLGTFQQSLAFTFQFFGVNRTSVFINSKGNLTFGSGSTLAHFNAGGGVNSLGTDVSDILDRIANLSPRIAPLWQDWNPGAAGAGEGVFRNSFSDALIVTWNAVPLFGTSTTATFQVILFDTGVIRMSYQTVPATPGGGYFTGISPGSGSQFEVTTIDFSEGSASSISDSPNSEPLGQVFGTITSPLVHISAVARRFFNTHGDNFDQLVMFANFTHSLSGFFELTTRQTVSGIGRGPPFFRDTSSYFGSAGQIQSFINMNRLDILPADPNATLSLTNSTLDLLGQETGHMWLVGEDLEFNDAGVCTQLPLGRDDSHWSFFQDTEASVMEGNNWRDNNDGTFTTIEATDQFSTLDQYMMGLRTASETPDFFFIDNPSATGGKNQSSDPTIGVTVNGTRKDVTINDVTFCTGARSPSSGFTGVNSSTTWKQAFVLLIPEGTTAPNADTSKLDTIRSAWVTYFKTNTDNRGALNAALVPVISVTPSSLDLGNVGVGSSADLTFTVKNTGGGTLSGSASASAPFSIVGSSSYSLAFNENKTITVRFSPTSLATFLANVTFTAGGGATRQVSGVGARAFSDDPLVAGTTPIKRVHITELRTAANEKRADGGLGSFPFTDPTLTAGVTTVKRVHITELRTALIQAASALGKPAPSFPTDPTIVAGQTVIKKAHINDLRDAVRELD